MLLHARAPSSWWFAQHPIYLCSAFPFPLQQVASKLIGNEMKGRRTGYMAADESVEDIHLLSLPPELEAFISSGPTFDYTSHLQQEACNAITQLNSSFTGPAAAPPAAAATATVKAEAAEPAGDVLSAARQKHAESTAMKGRDSTGQGSGGSPVAGSGSSSSFPGGPPSSKRVWAAQRAVADASSDALLSLARSSFTSPSTLTDPSGGPFGTSPQLARLLSSDVMEGGGTAAGGQGTVKQQVRSVRPISHP
jgi:hypothetical protein